MKRIKSIKRDIFKALFLCEKFFKNSNVIAATCLFAIICTIPTLVEGGEEHPFIQLLCMVTDVFLLCILLNNVEYDEDPDTSNREV